MEKIKRIINIFKFILNKFPNSIIFALIFMIIFSQIFLLISYFLPIKVLLFIATGEISSETQELFFNLNKDQIILFLTFSVFIVYLLHLFFEFFIDKALVHLLKKHLGFEKIVKKSLEFKYIDAFIKLISNILLILILSLLIVIFYNFIGIFITFYFLLILFIILNTKDIRNRMNLLVKIMSAFGFMSVFILEVLDTIYISQSERSVYIILIVLLLSRYIFNRINSIVSKSSFIYFSFENFIKKIEEDK